jgi:hypothetical protein
LGRQRKEGDAAEERPEIPSALFGVDAPAPTATAATAVLESPPAPAKPPAKQKAPRVPRIGQSVIYGGFGIPPHPCHAVVAAIRLDGSLNMSTLGAAGDWGTSAGIPYSPVLRSGFWSWVEDIYP